MRVLSFGEGRIWFSFSTFCRGKYKQRKGNTEGQGELTKECGGGMGFVSLSAWVGFAGAFSRLLVLWGLLFPRLRFLGTPLLIGVFGHLLGIFLDGLGAKRLLLASLRGLLVSLLALGVSVCFWATGFCRRKARRRAKNCSFRVWRRRFFTSTLPDAAFKLVADVGACGWAFFQHTKKHFPHLGGFLRPEPHFNSSRVAHFNGLCLC
jgi:hypothetical protein